MYGHLKTCLLKESALTNTNRAAHLLDFPGIGDLKPSQLMTKMMLLLPDKERTKPSCLFREIFLRQLPLEVRAHLTDKEGMTLKELSYKADKFYSSTGARISLVRSGRTFSRWQWPRPEHLPDRPRSGVSRYGIKAKKCKTPCACRQGNKKAVH